MNLPDNWIALRARGPLRPDLAVVLLEWLMFGRLKELRLSLSGLTLVASIVLANVGYAQQAQAVPAYTDWFAHHEELTGAWEFSEINGDPNQVEINSTLGDDNKAKKVLVLYPKKSSAYDIAMSKILDVYASKNMNTVFRAFNFRRDDGAGAMALDLAEQEAYDLIFSMGSESTAWLYTYYRNGEIPVVSVCSKDPVVLGQSSGYDTGSGTNFAFTSLNMPINVQIAYLQDFMPGLKNIGILVDSRNISAVRTQAKPMKEAAKRKGINVQYVAVQDPSNVAAELEPLMANAIEAMRVNDPALAHSLFWITGSTAVFREIGAINRFSLTVPVVSAVPEVVTEGDDSAVISIGISFESNAHLAALYGLDVLNKIAEPGELKVGIVSPPDIAINFRRARDIGLEVPFSFFESANYVYDYDGKAVRRAGKKISSSGAIVR